MPRQPVPSPRAPGALADLYFIENRTRLLEVAAFLDRLDRAAADEPAGGREDARVRALREALAILSDGEGDRVVRLQSLFSDPTEEPIANLDQKSARGVYDRWHDRMEP